MKEALFKLKPCPPEGQGVHTWVYYAACTLVDAEFTDEEAEPEIEYLMTRPPNPASEIRDALAAARGERKSSQPRWSRPDPIAIAKIAKEGLTLKKLIEGSPEPIDLAGPLKTDQLIDLFFPGDPWLCCGRTDWLFYTRRKSVWRGLLDSDKLENYSLVVPSPMTEQWGHTKQGKLSYHTESNTGNRRFLVVEFDSGPLDQQAALLWHLAQYAPLVAVVFSGSKSLHAFFFCEGQPEEKLQRFFNYATSLGADPRTWLRSQFVRMPEGRRNGEFDARKADQALRAAGITLPCRRQRVLYFNPEVIR